MLDEKKIEEAAKNILQQSRGYGFIISQTEINVFKAGAHWAIEQFLKGLWHNANEKPKGYNNQILLQFFGKFYSVERVANFVSWERFAKKGPDFKWLYIDNLLLKQEGGNNE